MTGDMPPGTEELRLLADEAACRRVLSRYAPAIDWLDRDTLAEIFWPDADIDCGAGFFMGTGAQYPGFVVAGLKDSVRRMHMPGNIRIAVLGGSAVAENAGINQLLTKMPDGTILASLFTARYLWKLEKRAGEWRISSFVLLINSAQHAPYDASGEPPNLNLGDGLSVDSARFPGMR